MVFNSAGWSDIFNFNSNLFHFPPIHYKVKDHMAIEIVKQYKLYMQVIVKAVPLRAWSGPEGSRKLNYHNKISF